MPSVCAAWRSEPVCSMVSSSSIFPGPNEQVGVKSTRKRTVCFMRGSPREEFEDTATAPPPPRKAAALQIVENPGAPRHRRVIALTPESCYFPPYIAKQGLVRMMTRRAVGVWLAGWMGLLLASSAGAAQVPRKPPLLVFAASSLTDVVDELDQAFTASTGIPVKASYASSSALAKQVEAGAPADVFFSADIEWVDYLDQRKLLKPGTRRDVVANRLVLIAPQDSALRIKIAPHFDLAGALGEGKLATGDPDSVPVGKYAKAALEKLGAWDSVSSHVVRAENVRSALAFVARGEAAL